MYSTYRRKRKNRCYHPVHETARQTICFQITKEMSSHHAEPFAPLLPLCFASALGLGCDAGQSLNGATKGTKGIKEARWPLSCSPSLWLGGLQGDDLGHKWSQNGVFDVLIIMTIVLSNLMGFSSRL